MARGSVTITYPNGSTVVRTFNALPVTIGRAPSNEVQVNDPSVSPLHVRIALREDGSTWVEDLDARYGTHLGDNLVPPSGAVQLHQTAARLRLGNVHIEVEIEEGGPGAVIATVTGEAVAAGPAAAPGRVVVELDPAERAKLQKVTAGQRVELTLSIKNFTGATETFWVTVAGLPPEWVELPPPVQLNWTDHKTEKRLLAITPPKSPEATAQSHPFSIRVQAEGKQDKHAETRCELGVEPYSKVELRIDPRRSNKKFTVSLGNEGNHEGRYSLVFNDPPWALVARITNNRDVQLIGRGNDIRTDEIPLGPGATMALKMEVRRKGRDRVKTFQTHGFTIQAMDTSTKPEAEVAKVDGTLDVQPGRPIRRWIVTAAAVLVLLGLGGHQLICPYDPGSRFCYLANPDVQVWYRPAGGSLEQGQGDSPSFGGARKGEPGVLALLVTEGKPLLPPEVDPALAQVAPVTISTPAARKDLHWAVYRVVPKVGGAVPLTLKAEHAGWRGQVQKSITLFVDAPEPVIRAFGVSPSEIVRGATGEVELSWQVDNGDQVTVDLSQEGSGMERVICPGRGGGETLGPADSPLRCAIPTSVIPGTPVAFTLRAKGDRTQPSMSVTVTLKNPTCDIAEEARLASSASGADNGAAADGMTLIPGDVVEVLAPSDDGQWYYVAFPAGDIGNAAKGWVRKQAACAGTQMGAVTGLPPNPAYGAPPAPTATPTPSAAPAP